MIPVDNIIIQNAAICLSCNDYIFSKHRHDFVQCSCGAIFVDGGQEYLRRGGDLNKIADMSWELPRAVYDKCSVVVEEALATGRNKYGVANAVLRALREVNRIVAAGEHRVIAVYNDEVLVETADGNVSRYKLVEDNVVE